MSKTNRDLEVAYHEAGHVVAALLEDVQITCVTIIANKEDNYNGRAFMAFYDEEQRKKVKPFISFAGPWAQAELHVRSLKRPRKDSWDIKYGNIIVCEGGQSDADDYAHISIDGLPEWKERLNNCWGLIEAIAIPLSEKKSLYCGEILYIAETYMRSLKDSK